jgi:hypothetical protein
MSDGNQLVRPEPSISDKLYLLGDAYEETVFRLYMGTGKDVVCQSIGDEDYNRLTQAVVFGKHKLNQALEELNELEQAMRRENVYRAAAITSRNAEPDDRRTCLWCKRAVVQGDPHECAEFDRYHAALPECPNDADPYVHEMGECSCSNIASEPEDNQEDIEPSTCQCGHCWHCKRLLQSTRCEECRKVVLGGGDYCSDHQG